jgi:hypothetical protein
MYKNAKFAIITIVVFSVIAIIAYLGGISRVFAAGVSVSLSPSSITATTATEISISYIATTDYANTNTVSIAVPAGITLANCAAPTTDADADSTTDGSSAVLGQIYTYTFSASTTNADTSGVSFCINLTAPTGNYNVSFTDAKTIPTNNDFGAALLYVGSANIVTVTAQVQPALAFVIRNGTDTANTNICALGTLSLTAVNTCSYRLKVTTNSSSGFSLQIDSDGDLRNSGSGNVADNLDIDIIADNATVTSGTEGYGISLAGGAITGGTLTEATTASYTFQTDSSPLPINSPQTMITANGTNNPGVTDTTNTALVTHLAAMDGDTSTGNYSQQLTYTVSASF